MTSPTLGVVIPARNAATTLERTLRSVFAQSSVPSEVVVVDDQSSDDTSAVASGLAATVLMGKGVGAAAARNTAMEIVTADYIAFLDADDAWPANYCASVLASIAQTDADLVVAPRSEINDFGAYLGERALNVEQLTPLGILERNPITTSGVVARRSRLLAIGGFSEDIRHCEDADLWVRLLADGVRTTLQPVPVIYTVRDSRESVALLRDVEDNRRRLLHRASDLLGLSPAAHRAVEQAMLSDLSLRYLKSGRRWEALRCIRQIGVRPRVLPLTALALMPESAQSRVRHAWRRVRRARA